MDQHARENIAAAAAVHQELGRDYDRALAEGLIERISEEIDKRVDARLAGPPGPPGPPGYAPQPATRPPLDQWRPAGRSGWPSVVLGLGSMGIAAGVTAGIVAGSATDNGYGVSHHFGPYQVLLTTVLWIIIAIINVAFARRP